jgi:hypothetical protein
MADDLEIRWTARTDGGRTATTHGLYEFRHPELTVRVDGPPEEARDRWVSRLLGHLAVDIAEHLLDGRAPFRAGDELRWGWSTVRLVEPVSADGELHGVALAIEECAGPFGQDDRFAAGVARTLHIAMAQAAAVERHGLKGQMDPLHSTSMAMVCKRVLDEVSTRGMLRAIRGPADDEDSSDWWQIDCNDDGHDHEDSANQSIMHLGHVVEAFPAVLQYLALPCDSAFVIAEGKVAVFRPGDEEYQFDPGDPLSWRP